MRKLAIAMALAACGNNGDGATDAAVDASSMVRVGPFASLMYCTSGNEGEPTCPFNFIALDTPGAMQLRFVATPIAANLAISSVRITPGTNGIYLVHPRFETYASGSTTPVPAADVYPDVMLNEPPGGQPVVLANFVIVPAPYGLGIAFDALGDYRP